MRKRTILRRPGVALLLALACTSLVGKAAIAGECGGALPCQCGDRVVASVVLSGHLDGCDGNGLVLQGGILDCADHQISGPGDNTTFAGVVVEGDGTVVRNCRVRNFGDGIRLEGATSAEVSTNVVFSNRHGIWVGSGASGTVIDGNEVRDNEDEGIHLGSGTTGSAVRNNQIYANDAENVYLLGTTGNVVEDNVLGSAKAAGIYVKNSWGNILRRNRVEDRPILVRGDSFENHFEENVLLAGGYVFEAQEQEGVWFHPRNHTIVGGSIDASTCFEFLGSYGNQATDVVVDDCRHVEEKAFGGLVPYGNVVSVIDLSPGSGSEGNGGGANGRVRKGRIRKSRPVGDDADVLSLDLTIPGEVLIDPDTEEFELTLSDDDSVVYRVLLPAGLIEKKNSARYQYRPRKGAAVGGIKKLKLVRHPVLGWSVGLRAKTNLDAADEGGLTMEWRIGDDEGFASQQWTPRNNGWSIR